GHRQVASHHPRGRPAGGLQFLGPAGTDDRGGAGNSLAGSAQPATGTNAIDYAPLSPNLGAAHSRSGSNIQQQRLLPGRYPGRSTQIDPAERSNDLVALQPRAHTIATNRALVN